MNAIATGFKNLRYLTIHVAFGISSLKDLAHWMPGVKTPTPMDEAFSSVLTKSIAEDFAKQLFDTRGASFLQMVTLKTGEKHRWFPQWAPLWANMEQQYATTIEISAPLNIGEQVCLNELENDSSKLRRLLQRRQFDRSHWFGKPKPLPLSRAPRVPQTPSLPMYN